VAVTAGPGVGTTVARARTAVGTVGTGATGAVAAGCAADRGTVAAAAGVRTAAVGVPSGTRAPSGLENPIDRATRTATAMISSRPRPSHGIPPPPPRDLPRDGRGVRPRACATPAEY